MHVVRPRIIAQPVLRGDREPAELQPLGIDEPVDVVAQQIRHVLGVLAQRRHAHDQRVQVRQQVAAELHRSRVFDAGARRRDDPRLQRNGAPPPTRTNWPLSSTPSSARCACAGRSSSSLMNSVPPPARSSTPGVTGRRPRCRTAAAPRRRPQRAGDQGDERPRGTRARFVHEAREGLAAGAGLADQQHRRIVASRSARDRRAAAASRGCGPRARPAMRLALAGMPLRLPASSARSTVRSSFCSDSGFSTKSKAPRRVASTAVSTVPWPDIMTTGQNLRGRARTIRAAG